MGVNVVNRCYPSWFDNSWQKKRKKASILENHMCFCHYRSSTDLCYSPLGVELPFFKRNFC